MWDENGGSQTYLISSDLDVEGLRNSLRMMMPHEPIDVRGEESRIVLTGTVSTEAVADAAVKLATLYDLTSRMRSLLTLQRLNKCD